MPNFLGAGLHPFIPYLNNINDVFAPFPTNGYVLTWSDSLGGWHPAPVSAAGTLTREIDVTTGSTGNTHTLTSTPASNTLLDVYKNGLLLREGATEDYTVSGVTVTLAVTLVATDVIVSKLLKVT